MARTNWQDPKTSEIRSTHISGLQEAVGKLEESVGIETVSETDIPLIEVYISSDDRYRMFQAPEGKRNWLLSPAPVIKKNGVVITDDFEIDYGGGAVIFTTPISESDILTADATYTKKVEGKQLSTNDYSDEEKEKLNEVVKNVGNIQELTTTDKTNLVNAINEVNNKSVDLTPVEERMDEIEDNLAAHKAESVQQFEEIYNRLSKLKGNDIQARREILDIKLKLDEMKVIDYLNKTGIGFYDLFENIEYIDISNTTATVDTASADVIFTGQESLKMLPQKFDENFNNIELAIYDIERENFEVDNSVSNSNQIQISVQSGKINIGEKYYYNGEVYEVTGVSEA